jgi:DNA-binding NtrC family response regulator
MTVLLVEDDQRVRELMHLLLTEGGYDVVSTGCVSEAIRLASVMTHLDILVSDVVLSRGTGFDVQVFVEAKHPAVRTLFVTGYAIPDVRADDAQTLWLEKPFTQDQLLRSLNRLMNPPSRIVMPHADPSPELA